MTWQSQKQKNALDRIKTQQNIKEGIILFEKMTWQIQKQKKALDFVQIKQNIKEGFILSENDNMTEQHKCFVCFAVFLHLSRWIIKSLIQITIEYMVIARMPQHVYFKTDFWNTLLSFHMR